MDLPPLTVASCCCNDACPGNEEGPATGPSCSGGSGGALPPVLQPLAKARARRSEVLGLLVFDIAPDPGVVDDLQQHVALACWR